MAVRYVREQGGLRGRRDEVSEVLIFLVLFGLPLVLLVLFLLLPILPATNYHEYSYLFLFLGLLEFLLHFYLMFI